MKHTITALLIALALALTGCSVATSQDAPVSPTHNTRETTQPVPVQATQPTCEEDEPCWNCHTMGNKQCGPTPTVAPTATASAVAVPSQPATVAPVTASQPLPVEQGTTAPIATPTHSTAPVAVPTTAPTAQPVAPTTAQPVAVPIQTAQPVTCESRGMLTAEDHSCVPQNYYDTKPQPQPTATIPPEYVTALCHKIAHPEKSPYCVGIK